MDVQLQWIDWISIIAFFVLSLGIGLAVTKKAGSNTAEFFLSGRNMPWWLLGVGMVATTFSTDTPNLVTDMVRSDGVAKNWSWWAYLLTGMLTVFVYAKLWRRSGVLTDLEFYEIRYSGKAAAFLRGFRAIYLGVFFNIMIMAAVSVAAIKIGYVMFEFPAWQTLLIAGTITVIYSSLGGLTSVLLTDFFQFIVAMTGAVMAAYYALGHESVGGLSGLLAKVDADKLRMLPALSDKSTWMSLIVVPLAVQWWATWYPGAEPGGGGYIAQRMLSAKSEKHAVGATFFFNAAHYALRPWPWILVALASMIVYPDLAALGDKFPHVPGNMLRNDLAYPAMLKTVLPNGWLGVVVASLIAAYMSTIATHLNWGSSYVVNDWYRRFVKPEASEKQLVTMGRISTVVMMVFASILALWLENALKAFNILVMIGAGTGLMFIMRWFWWRINAWTEITAMVVSFIVAIVFQFIDFDANLEIFIGVAITTTAWVAVSFITPPADEETRAKFNALVFPTGHPYKDLPLAIICMIAGCIAVYSALFATGYWIYGEFVMASVLTVVAAVASITLFTLWGKIEMLEDKA